MPALRTVMQWLEKHDDFAQQYARAMLLRADAKFDELDDLSEEAEKAESAVKVQGLRLKADNLKWQLARMNAKKYGDRMQTELTGADGGPIETKEMSENEIARRVAFTLAQGLKAKREGC